MNKQQFKQIRVMITLFIGCVVAASISNQGYLLATLGVTTGMLFLIVLRSKITMSIDEREQTIREKAAHLTYAIFAPTLAIAALLLLVPYKELSSVFAKGEFAYFESIGMVLAYLALFMITVYAISYYVLKRKFGGSSD
jgi:uncharacterized membrane protein